MLKPFALLAASTLAAVIGTSCPTQAGEVECHANKEYHVAVQSYDEDAGSRLAVTALKGKKKSARCTFDASKADLLIGEQGDPLWFDKLAGKFLILRRSTGPQGDLVVYDLESRKPVLDVPADDYELSGNRLSFWQRERQATAKDCPTFAENQANGLGSVISVRKTLDTKTLKVAATTEQRCDATQ
ncbi:hypothetical protein JJB09_05130 [Rhizobium sp. KVB221]|uniref:DUF992 domain-containing protein n=1 Tax=Rhizobium setariae TaxID=2801340 RepID=A0A936YNJ7_9HYPH|nr:hypothetical protein [Rhizobium setariae]MBL0371404.1 hypothetical protein [Rhizobium setariae]